MRVWPFALLALATFALGACVLGGWAGSELLGLLPVLLLCSSLLLRRFPGERLLLARRRCPARRPRMRAIALPRASRVVLAVRGSLLMGRSLAVRPPPGARAAA